MGRLGRILSAAAAMAAALAVGLAVALAPARAMAQAVEFTDVTDATPHAEDIRWMAEEGITRGYPNGDGTYRFEGTWPVYRQDMAAFLHRLAKHMGNEGTAVRDVTFSDVDPSTPHYEDIVWMAQTGVSTGWDNGDGTASFRGTDTVRRQDAAAFLYRVADLQDDGLVNGSLRDGPDGIAFADFDYADAGLHGPEVRWMATNGISEGWEEADGSRTFRGMSEIVRQDMAAFIHREYDHVSGAVPLSGCEAVLYSDGELVFQRAGTGAEAGREVVAIGDWYGQDSDYYWHTDTFRPHRYEVRRVSSRGRVRADKSPDFSNCENLTDISGLSGWDVSGVTDMGGAFWWCSSLADLSPLSGWDVSGVTDMSEAFQDCISLADASPLEGWNVGPDANTGGMFDGTGVTSYPSWYGA